LGGDFVGGGEETVPIEWLAGHEGSDVCYVDEAFPEMFGAVNRDEHEFVFEGGRGYGVAVKRDLDLALKQLLDGKRAGMVAEGFFGVQLDEKLGTRMAKDVFARDFLRLDRSYGNPGFVAEGEHELRGAEDVAIADDEVKVAILTEAGIGVAALREDGTLDHQGFDLRTGKIREEAKHLRGEIQSEESLIATPRADLFEALRRDGGFVLGKELTGGEGERAVVLGECDEGGPVDRNCQAIGECRGIEMRFGARQQERPFSVEHFGFARRDVRQSQPPDVKIIASAKPDCSR